VHGADRCSRRQRAGAHLRRPSPCQLSKRQRPGSAKARRVAAALALPAAWVAKTGVGEGPPSGGGPRPASCVGGEDRGRRRPAEWRWPSPCQLRGWRRPGLAEARRVAVALALPAAWVAKTRTPPPPPKSTLRRPGRRTRPAGGPGRLGQGVRPLSSCFARRRQVARQCSAADHALIASRPTGWWPAGQRGAGRDRRVRRLSGTKGAMRRREGTKHNRTDAAAFQSFLTARNRRRRASLPTEVSPTCG